MNINLFCFLLADGTSPLQTALTISAFPSHAFPPNHELGQQTLEQRNVYYSIAKPASSINKSVQSRTVIYTEGQRTWRSSPGSVPISRLSALPFSSTLTRLLPWGPHWSGNSKALCSMSQGVHSRFSLGPRSKSASLLCHL